MPPRPGRSWRKGPLRPRGRSACPAPPPSGPPIGGPARGPSSAGVHGRPGRSCPGRGSSSRTPASRKRSDGHPLTAASPSTPPAPVRSTTTARPTSRSGRACVHSPQQAAEPCRTVSAAPTPWRRRSPGRHLLLPSGPGSGGPIPESGAARRPPPLQLDLAGREATAGWRLAESTGRRSRPRSTGRWRPPPAVGVRRTRRLTEPLSGKSAKGQHSSTHSMRDLPADGNRRGVRDGRPGAWSATFACASPVVEGGRGMPWRVVSRDPREVRLAGQRRFPRALRATFGSSGAGRRSPG